MSNEHTATPVRSTVHDKNQHTATPVRSTVHGKNQHTATPARSTVHEKKSKFYASSVKSLFGDSCAAAQATSHWRINLQPGCNIRSKTS